MWLLPGGMHGCSGGVHGFTGGVHGCSWGGMHGCSREVCMVAPGGHAWLLLGGGHAWLLQEGHAVGGHVWLLPVGGHVWLLLGGVVAPGGVWLLLGECVWDMTRYGDTINEWAVRILLECILVNISFLTRKHSSRMRNDRPCSPGGGMLLRGIWHYPLPVNRQTRVKTFPSHNFICRR